MGPRSQTPRPSRLPAGLAPVAARVDAARSRGAVKSLGRAVDEDADLRRGVEALAAHRGVEVDASWTGKKLVRAARVRESSSRVRSNPIRRDQAFVCVHCGREVEAGGGRVRDHCPFCLRSLHVDVVPGDRAAACGGVYDPIGFERSHGAVVIQYRCRTCGNAWRGRAHPDDRIPADFDPASLPGPASVAEGTLSAVQKRARTLPRRVLEVIRRDRLWDPGQRVAVAVSGGLDSTVLLELLAELADGHGAQLEVISIDHGLRPESAGEVARVGRRARALGLPFHAISLQIPGGPGIAARARDARWTALEELQCDRIATAHHRDDQAETVLQHLLRGSGARGLRGMAPRDGVRVRPLLFEPRAVLQRWAEDRGLSWDEDPSNPGSERGRIRSLMPLLDELREGAAGGLARSARLLARDDAFLEAHIQAIWAECARDGRLSVTRWKTRHPAEQLRLLLALVEPVPHGVGIRADQLERLLTHDLPTGTVFELAGGWRLVVNGDWLGLSAPPVVEHS